MTMKLMSDERKLAIHNNIESAEGAIATLNNYIRAQMRAGVEPAVFHHMIIAINNVDAVMTAERTLLEHGGDSPEEFLRVMVERSSAMAAGKEVTWARKNADIVHWLQSNNVVSIEEATRILFPPEKEGRLE